MSKYLYDFSSKSYKRNPQILFSRDNDHHLIFKVHLTSKYFFRSNKSLHLFETRCAFLPLFNPNIDPLQAFKVTKSGHHLSHDRASEGYGSTPCLTSQTSLHTCLQRRKKSQDLVLNGAVRFEQVQRFI